MKFGRDDDGERASPEYRVGRPLTSPLYLKDVAYSTAILRAFPHARPHRSGVAVRVLGLPLSSVFVLIVIPLVLVAYQYYVCWQIKTGRRE
jgi:hypothetical protein